MRVYRGIKIQGGILKIDYYLPSEYAETNSSTDEVICCLLDFYFEK